MKKRALLLGVIVVGVAAGAAAWKWNPALFGAQPAVAQAPPAARLIPVEVAQAIKKDTPVLIEALGTVTPIASVAIKPRIDSEITEVHFADGARVKQGDVLVTLDGRAIEAQILQAEGNVARDKAQLEGAERDLRRYTELVAKSATPVTNLDNAKTQAAVFAAAQKADEAILKNLLVQLSYATIKAPISGRISAASVKVGNFVRSADLTPIATIIQTAPVYVTFPTPQIALPALRDAMAEGLPTVEAMVPGDNKRALGRVAMIDNTVDSATGMVSVRATMPNENEVLWPGTLVNTQLNLRQEQAVIVPSAAMQTGQRGSYLFVIKDGVASVVAVKIARTLGKETVLESGLEGGEQVVTDGHLQLVNGSKVVIRTKAGS
ncbi:MAG: rane fusion protein multidrug efflux system [Hyphomicrobiales bacterium]